VALERVSVDADCKDGLTCPSVWADESDPETAVVVGVLEQVHGVPLGPGEVAVRVRRQVLRDAEV
jgi:hypothetical protein